MPCWTRPLVDRDRQGPRAVEREIVFSHCKSARLTRARPIRQAGFKTWIRNRLQGLLDQGIGLGKNTIRRQSDQAQQKY